MGEILEISSVAGTCSGASVAAAASCLCAIRMGCHHAAAARRAHRFPLAELSDELVLSVGAFLDSKSLQSLALVSRRFSKKAAPVVQHGVIVDSLSLAQEAARQQWYRHSAEQQNQVPWVGHERWLHMLRRMEVLTAPLVFHGQYRGGDIMLSKDRRTMTKTIDGAGASGLLDATLMFSQELVEPTTSMRRGRHYAEFSVVARASPGPAHFSVGIVDHSSVRPRRLPSDSPSGRGSLEPPSGGGRARDASAYLFDTNDGLCLDWTGVDWAKHSWQTLSGRWPSQFELDRIGLLLDVDAGKLSVYRNRVKLGTMVRDLNKQGQYVWMLQIVRVGDAVKVDGPLRPPDTS